MSSYRTLDEYPPVPPRILNHPQFQEFLRPFGDGVDPRIVYVGYLNEAGGSDDALFEALSTYQERLSTIPKLGAGEGPKRTATLNNGVALEFTYVKINDIPQYAVEMRVNPPSTSILRDAGPIHGIGADEILLPVGDVYYMAINQVFRAKYEDRSVLSSVPDITV